jgi:mRNA interferase RelE/StbE
MLFMYSIEFTRDAAKAMAKLPRDLQALMLEKIEAVAAAPYEQHNNVKRLQGRPEFRLRVHDWRVIYRVQDDRVVLLVIKIASRGEVYK